jgi:hypothetical protein
MHWKPLAAFALIASLAGCATLTERDRQILHNRRIPTPLYEKMLRNRPLVLAEIVELSRKNVPPELIVRYLDDTFAAYPLRTEDVLWLRRAGVRDEVIDYLLRTPTLRLEEELATERLWPPLYYPPVIIHRHDRRR